MYINDLCEDYMDYNWKSALMASLDILHFLDVIYTHGKFFPYSRKFYPLEFSQISHGDSVGFCVRKDLLYKIGPQLLLQIDSPHQVIYLNDVFVVCCINPPKSIEWFYSVQERYNEYMELRESALIGSLGRHTTQYWYIEKKEAKKRILVIGASNMGNIGDDLIALSIGKHLRNAKSDCAISFSDFNVSKADLNDFDLVIVGGGGIVYSMGRAENNETENLANYFKFPYWANDLSIPCVIVGVGIPENPDHLFRDPYVIEFLTKALSYVSAIIVRDNLSKITLEAITKKQVILLPDLVFSYAREYPYYQSVNDIIKSNSIAFIGEIFSKKLTFFNNLLTSYFDDDYKMFKGKDIYYIVMSNDDECHKEQFITLLASKGIECYIHDIRTASIYDALNIFKNMSGVITTRFHGLVLSIISGCPAITVDISYGKNSRLIMDYFPSIKNNLIDETTEKNQILLKFDNFFNNPKSMLPSIDEVEAVNENNYRYIEILNAILSDNCFNYY